MMTIFTRLMSFPQCAYYSTVRLFTEEALTEITAITLHNIEATQQNNIPQTGSSNADLMT